MIIVADSGTTKTDWEIIDPENHKEKYFLKTVGFNPYYQTSDEAYETLKKELIPQIKENHQIEKIFFYGAALELEDKKAQFRKALQRAFPQADIKVEHDLLGAARAVLGNNEGIACISGTGSNTCYYDGNKIVRNVYALGLFLGDEGSGGYKGKLFVRDYIRQLLPQKIKELYEAEYNDRTEEILDSVYLKEFPSRYLASFMPFIIKYKDEPYMKALIKESFGAMFNNCIRNYDKVNDVPISFIGSIAYLLKDYLHEVAAENGLQVQDIIKEPLEHLTHYHLQEL